MIPPRSVPDVRWELSLRWGLAVSGWLAWAAFAALPDGAALRVLVVTTFLLLCPGLAAARWVRSPASRWASSAVVLETAVLAVVISLCLSVLTAVAFYLSGAFTTTRVLVVLAAVTSALALSRRPHGPHPRPPRDSPHDIQPAQER